MKKGEYKTKIEASRPRGLTEDGIRKAKNQRSHVRNTERKQEKRSQAEERQKEREERTDKEQMTLLKKRGGNFRKEYLRLKERMKK